MMAVIHLLDFLRDPAWGIVTLGAAIGTISLGVRFCWKRFVRPFVDVVRSAAELVNAQLNVNSGSSLVDKVNSLTIQVADFHRKQTELITGQQALNERLGKLEEQAHHE